MKISEFQKLMRDLYFHQDSKRGIKATFIWLTEEIGELARLINKEIDNKEKIEEELADIIAWTCSLANLFNIELESALFKKYPNICKKCNSKPCKCGKND
ncbi:MAG: MazG nucleotide pyrophosphohydrolase domain-containing protein [Promethearchaeota archaeon]